MLDRGAQPLWIGVHPDRIRLHDQLQALPIRFPGQRRDELAEVETPPVEAEVTGLELADLEHVLGETIEVAALAAKLEDRIALGGGQRGGIAQIGDRDLDLRG